MASDPPAFGQDWPEWRGGPLRDGRWEDKSLAPTLPPEGPKVLWKQGIGAGFGGPAVANGRVYIMDRQLPPAVDDELEQLVCLDARDGHPLWTNSYRCVLNLSGGYANGPRTTPTVRDGRVYTLGAMGHLFCLDAAAGSVVWSKDLRTEYHAQIPPWGMANAPWIEGNLLVVQVGGVDTNTVMAFDRGTGREVWRNLTGKAGYASIVGAGVGQTRELLVWTANGLSALNPSNGFVLWSQPRTEKWDQTVATPVFDPQSNQVIISSDREGSLALQLKPGEQTAGKLWEGSAFSALHSTPVLKDGFIYGINHDGNRYETCGEFRCVELATGHVQWAVTNVTKIGRWAQAHVTLNTGSDTFYISNELGELILAKATPQGYQEIARAQVCGKTWSHPAYAGKRMFARAETSLVCLSLETPPR